MEETKTLQMTFANAANGRVTISIQDPREDLDALDVETAMDEILAANIITSNGGDFTNQCQNHQSPGNGINRVTIKCLSKALGQYMMTVKGIG